MLRFSLPVFTAFSVLAMHGEEIPLTDLTRLDLKEAQAKTPPTTD